MVQMMLLLLLSSTTIALASFGSSLFRVGDLSGFHGRFRAAAALT